MSALCGSWSVYLRVQFSLVVFVVMQSMKNATGICLCPPSGKARKSARSSAKMTYSLSLGVTAITSPSS